MSNVPKQGYRVLKGFGQRLVRNVTEDASGNNGVDDWFNVMVLEGIAGWKKGLAFERVYAYQAKTATAPAHHLYRIIVTRQKGLEVLCAVYGRKSDTAWDNAFTALYEKGVMPEDSYNGWMSGDKNAA